MTGLVARIRTATPTLAALTAIQVANALVPLLIFPFAFVTLGVEAYTELATAEAVGVVVTAAVLYSFEIDGVRKVVALKELGDEAGLRQLVATILVTRLTVWAAVSLVAIVLFYSLQLGDGCTLFGWLLVALGNAFYGNCIYQGLQRVERLAAFTLIARITGLLIVVALIEPGHSAALVSNVIGWTYLAGGLLAWCNLRRQFGLGNAPVSLVAIAAALREGWPITAGNFSVALYRDVNVLLLALFGTSATMVAGYSLAEKGIKLMQAIVRPVSLFLFPKTIAALRGQQFPSREAARIIFRYVAPQWLMLLATLIGLAVAMMFIAPHSETIREFADVGLVDMAIMMPAIIFGVGSFMFGSVGLNQLGERKQLLIMLTFVGVANLVGLSAMLALDLPYAAAWAFVGAEAVLLFLILTRFWRTLLRDQRC
jgi:O-antigen/teichoic acid export membrane protein